MWAHWSMGKKKYKKTRASSVQLEFPEAIVQQVKETLVPLHAQAWLWMVNPWWQRVNIPL